MPPVLESRNWARWKNSGESAALHTSSPGSDRDPEAQSCRDSARILVLQRQNQRGRTLGLKVTVSIMGGDTDVPTHITYS